MMNSQSPEPKKGRLQLSEVLKKCMAWGEKREEKGESSQTVFYSYISLCRQQIKKVKALVGWASGSPAGPLSPEESHCTLFLSLLSPHCMVALGPEPWLLMKEGWFEHLPKQVEIKTPIHYRRVRKKIPFIFILNSQKESCIITSESIFLIYG